jgi:FAS-associated factor 2
VEGPKSPEEMLNILQRVVEECAPSLVAARIEAEERRNNQRLRDEQDAAYRAALEADQVFLFLCRHMHVLVLCRVEVDDE